VTRYALSPSPGIAGMTGTDPVLIRTRSASIVTSSPPVSTRTVCGPVNSARPVSTDAVSMPSIASKFPLQKSDVMACTSPTARS
jgi:hypothetical protein